MNSSKKYSVILYVLTAFVFVAGAAGCASRRHSAAPAVAETTLPAMQEWNDIYMPFTMRLSRPVSLSFSGRATMVRDRSILLSMRMLGIEVAQVYLDADSTWVVDKFHKVVCVEPTSRITGSRGLTVANLQDMMIGRYSVELHGVSFDYLDFRQTPVGELPSSVEAAGAAGRLKVGASLSWNFDKARFNAGNIATWTPPGFRRVTPTEMIDILRNM